MVIWGVKQVVEGVALVVLEGSFIVLGVQDVVLGPSELAALRLSTMMWQWTMVVAGGGSNDAAGVAGDLWGMLVGSSCFIWAVDNSSLTIIAGGTAVVNVGFLGGSTGGCRAAGAQVEGSGGLGGLACFSVGAGSCSGAVCIGSVGVINHDMAVNDGGGRGVSTGN